MQRRDWTSVEYLAKEIVHHKHQEAVASPPPRIRPLLAQMYALLGRENDWDKLAQHWEQNAALR